ncbi:asparaginase [Nonomuraea montanisoli]|uniref:asparaginase n=1 Tax=Nonomuraea montanisoli TaxID=2741721 RepID=UPI0019641147|nr:asparaginase [Nonomuraea montanisoli]
MSKVIVLSTGGTIATRRDVQGVGLAKDGAGELLGRLPVEPGVEVDGVDVLCAGSYLFTPADMREVVLAVRAALADPGVLGVVVTHGTDAMEETAYLADLFHDDPRPVVFTGAQRPADAVDGDGPRNLADAITVAASGAARGLGALICFDGRVYAARGTRKTHTLAPAAFSAPDGGPLGRVRAGEVDITLTPSRPEPLDLGAYDLDGVRADIVALYPGCDAGALRAAADAGATGIVLEALGAGNANPAVAAEVARLTGAGVVVALSTRVDAGPVAALYGNGGGADLVAAGAIPTGILRAPQARVLLGALLGCHRDPARVREGLAARTGGVTATGRTRPADPTEGSTERTK